jgi:hypothetical protein
VVGEDELAKIARFGYDDAASCARWQTTKDSIGSTRSGFYRRATSMSGCGKDGDPKAGIFTGLGSLKRASMVRVNEASGQGHKPIHPATQSQPLMARNPDRRMLIATRHGSTLQRAQTNPRADDGVESIS